MANPQSPAAENPLVVTGNPEEVLQQQLATLALEEQQLQNQIRDRDLQRQIQDATARVAALRNELHEESSLHSWRWEIDKVDPRKGPLTVGVKAGSPPLQI